jgi:hypothetical protein
MWRGIGFLGGRNWYFPACIFLGFGICGEFSIFLVWSSGIWTRQGCMGRSLAFKSIA